MHLECIRIALLNGWCIRVSYVRYKYNQLPWLNSHCAALFRASIETFVWHSVFESPMRLLMTMIEFSQGKKWAGMWLHVNLSRIGKIQPQRYDEIILKRPLMRGIFVYPLFVLLQKKGLLQEEISNCLIGLHDKPTFMSLPIFSFDMHHTDNLFWIVLHVNCFKHNQQSIWSIDQR